MDAKSDQVLLESLDRGLLTLTLNRPERRNALNPELGLRLVEAATRAAGDPEVRAVLLKAEGPLTWTELRTEARLPQAFPNNQWVHRLENDIGLRRERDKHGIIHWQLSSASGADAKWPAACGSGPGRDVAS